MSNSGYTFPQFTLPKIQIHYADTKRSVLINSTWRLVHVNRFRRSIFSYKLLSITIKISQVCLSGCSL